MASLGYNSILITLMGTIHPFYPRSVVSIVLVRILLIGVSCGK